MAEIHIHPEIQHGNPVFKGTRIPVYQILQELVDGTSYKDILEGYPSLNHEHLALVDAIAKEIAQLQEQNTTLQAQLATEHELAKEFALGYKETIKRERKLVLRVRELEAFIVGEAESGTDTHAVKIRAAKEEEVG